MPTILGLSAFYHDSAACVVRDGEIVAAAQEERFTRKKHDAGFPARATAYCLREAGLTARGLDYVGFCRKPPHKVHVPPGSYTLWEPGLTPRERDYVAFYDKPLLKFERLLEQYLGVAPRGLRSFLTAMPVWLKDKLFTRRLLLNQPVLDGFEGEVL